MPWVALAAVVAVGLALPFALPATPVRTASAPPPRLDPIADSTGALAGGETMTLTGEHLASVSSVLVGDQPASVVSVTNEAVEIVLPNSADYAPETVAVTAWAGSEQLLETAQHTYEPRTAVDAQLQYAFEHWDSYNTAAFGDFNEWGGDCVNFVSQTLLARGWQQTPEWYNDAQTDWASPFVYAPDFDTWLAEHPELGATRLGDEQRELVKIGDVVLMDWDGNGFFNHAQIVSAVERVDGQVRVLMVGHNVDSTYRDLDRALADDPNGTAVFWSIP